METKKNGLVIPGLVLSIIAICISFIPIINNIAFILGLVAIVFGVISLIKKRSISKAIVTIVLGILSVVITLALQSSWSNALDEVSNDLDTMLGENTEEVLKNVDVNFGKFQVITDDFGLNETKLTVKITNKLNESKSFDFEIEAIDNNGNRIDTDVIYVSNLGANQSQSFEIFQFVDDNKLDSMKSASFKVIEASMY